MEKYAASQVSAGTVNLAQAQDKICYDAVCMGFRCGKKAAIK
jgi:hypothetical protein